MSVNKWIGIGNLTRDPELKYTPSGTAVCNFSIACNERFKGKDGQMQERAEFINIVAWRQLAEICGKYLTKGKQVYIEGKIQTRSYDDKDGNKRYITEIVADKMQMFGGGDGGNRQESRPAQRPSQGRERQPGDPDYNPAHFPPDDDLPF